MGRRRAGRPVGDEPDLRVGRRRLSRAASESPLIAELQARSAEKREQRRKESLERRPVNNFNDFFAVDNKSLVRHADGTFEALPKDVIAEG